MFLLSIVIRTVILYILLAFSLRITGKRQIGELDVSELVSTLLISEIASIPIDDPDIPMLNAIVAILLIVSIEIIISSVKNKSEKMLLTLTEPHKPELIQTMEKLKIKFDKVVLARTVSADTSAIDADKYQMVVLYSPADVTAFINGFAEDKRPMVATFGDGTTRFAINNGLVVRAMAPTPEAPSMAKALELFVGKVNAGEEPEPVALADNHQAEDFVKAVQAKDSRKYKSKKTTATATTTKK